MMLADLIERLLKEFGEEGDIPVFFEEKPMLHRNLYADAALIDGQKAVWLVLAPCIQPQDRLQ
jgi:hypothetical protein